MKDRFTFDEIREAELSLRQVAARNHISYSKVKSEITIAITAAKKSQDPAVMANWASSPFYDRTPTPEEFVAWCTRLINKTRHV